MKWTELLPLVTENENFKDINPGTVLLKPLFLSSPLRYTCELLYINSFPLRFNDVQNLDICLLWKAVLCLPPGLKKCM